VQYHGSNIQSKHNGGWAFRSGEPENSGPYAQGHIGRVMEKSRRSRQYIAKAQCGVHQTHSHFHQSQIGANDPGALGDN